MDLEGIMLSETSQRRTNTAYFTSMWNLQNKINKQNKMKTDLQIQRTNGWLPEDKG